jgi:pimeloyl-ACP methyl ester carboxylesterase
MSADLLRDLVLDVYRRNGGMPVHLVAHSMGGLLIRATLMQHGPQLWRVLGKIVFIATPHYGAPAIAGYLKNHLWGWELLALLGLYLSRDTFRSLWGVLGLLPAPRGIYPGTRSSDGSPWKSPDPGDSYVHPCANFDLYRAESWDLGLTAEELVRLQTVLDGAAALHQRMADAHSQLPQDLRDRMLVIAGVGYDTLFRVAYKARLFGLWTDMVKVTKRTADDRHREGDGRVPLASAELENVPVRYMRGVHGGLPNIPAVYEAVFNYLADKDPGLATTPRDALSSHLSADVTSSTAPNLDGSALAGPLSDPGYWQIDPPSDARLEELRLALEHEELPAFSRVRLL